MPLSHEDITALYRDNAPALLRFLMRRTFDAQVAVDLMAESFAVAYEQRLNFRGDGASGRGWIFGIANNLLSGFYRHGQIERRAVERLGIAVPLVSLEDFDRIEELAETAALRASVTAALGDLSDEHRQALQLRVIDECSYDEIATALDVTEQVARARVSRALRKLREVLHNNNPDEVMEHA
ncbi:MAG: sigma-70 family RNA polymerase sigma factor [Thermoleophilia bacterium]|nr:sigma-70 family RNA polymerase sigma factor [Thermoleophilia bacterium]